MRKLNPFDNLVDAIRCYLNVLYYLQMLDMDKSGKWGFFNVSSVFIDLYGYWFILIKISFFQLFT